MSTDTTEKGLEACIERYLTGGVSAMPRLGSVLAEDEEPPTTTKGAGYLRGKSTDFNTEFAIDTAKFWQFLESTQASELAKLHYKPDWKRQILERLHRKLKKDGILAVLKKGLDVDNAHFTLFGRCQFAFYLLPPGRCRKIKVDIIHYRDFVTVFQIPASEG